MSTLKWRRWGVAGVLAAACVGAGTFAAVHADARGGAPSTNAVTPPPAPKPLVQSPARTASPLAAPQVVATNVHCGQTLTASVTMNGDLSCSSGTALIITKSSVVLNLNGHQITGTAAGYYGVEVSGTSDTVENGAIVGFTNGSGVYGHGVTDTLTKLRLRGNGNGIYDSGSKTKITTNVATASQIGIIAYGASSTVTGNRVAGNSSYGIFVGGPGVLLSGNFANSNSVGIYEQGNGTTLTGNTAEFNNTYGIWVNEVSGATIDGGTNMATGNGWDASSGGTGIQCRNVVCVAP